MERYGTVEDSGLHAASNELIAKMQNEVSSKNPAVDTAAAPKTAQSEKLHITEQEGEIRSMNGNFPTRMIKSQPSQVAIITPTNSNTVNNTVSHDKSSIKEEKKSKYKRSSFGALLLDTTASSHNTPTLDHKPELTDKTKQAVSLPSVEKKEVNNMTEPKSCANSSSNDTIATAAHNTKPM